MFYSIFNKPKWRHSRIVTIDIAKNPVDTFWARYVVNKRCRVQPKKKSSVRWFTQLKFLPYFKWVQNFTYTSYLPTLLKCYNITKYVYLPRVHLSSTCTCTCTWCMCYSFLLHNLQFWTECVNPSEPVFCNINQSWSMLFWFICLLQIQN